MILKYNIDFSKSTIEKDLKKIINQTYKAIIDYYLGISRNEKIILRLARRVFFCIIM